MAKDTTFDNVSAHQVVVKNHLEVEGTSRLVGVVSASEIFPLGGASGISEGPRIDLQALSITILGQAQVLQNYGRDEAIISGREAVIRVSSLSGQTNYIEMDSFIDSQGNPIVDKVRVLVPSFLEDSSGPHPLPPGWHLHVSRRQAREVARKIALSVVTTMSPEGKLPVMVGNTSTSQRGNNMSEQPKLVSLPEPNAHTEIVSEDLAGPTENTGPTGPTAPLAITNANPNAHVSVYHDENTGNLTTVADSFAPPTLGVATGNFGVSTADISGIPPIIPVFITNFNPGNPPFASVINCSSSGCTTLVFTLPPGVTGNFVLVYSGIITTTAFSIQSGAAFNVSLSLFFAGGTLVNPLYSFTFTGPFSQQFTNIIPTDAFSFTVNDQDPVVGLQLQITNGTGADLVSSIDMTGMSFTLAYLSNA